MTSALKDAAETPMVRREWSHVFTMESVLVPRFTPTDCFHTVVTCLSAWSQGGSHQITPDHVKTDRLTAARETASSEKMRKGRNQSMALRGHQSRRPWSGEDSSRQVARGSILVTSTSAPSGDLRPKALSRDSCSLLGCQGVQTHIRNHAK